MNRVLIILITAALTVMVTTGVMLLVTKGQKGPPRAERGIDEPDPGLQGVVIPPFAMVNQDGEAVREALLEGRITIIDFIFTNCPFVCPPMSEQMRVLSTQLADTPVRFASFSVDPVRDTPEALKAFAAKHEADLSRWTFLSGEPGEVERILGAIGFELFEDKTRPIPLPDGSTMLNIAHPSKLMLIDGERRVLMLASFNDPEQVQELERRARALAEK